MRGDFAGAAETIEKAMLYGETIPEVRDLRLAAMLHDKGRNQDVLGEFEDALVDTDFHPLIMERAMASLVWNPEPVRYWSDGSEQSRFQCRRARILSNALRASLEPAGNIGVFEFNPYAGSADPWRGRPRQLPRHRAAAVIR